MLNRSTRKTPFQIVYCQPLSHALDLVPLPKLPGISIVAIQEEVRKNLKEFNARYKAAVDCKRRAKAF
jgi:hypothetical protein